MAMATYPPAHKRVQFLGTLQQVSGGGTDIFEFGFADDSALSTEALATALAPVYAAGWDASGIGASEYAHATGVRVEAVAADGKVSDSYYVAITDTPGAATGNTCTVLSHCLTLETATADGHGRNVRGRFYPPAVGGNIEGATVALSDISGYASSWRTFLTNCKAAGAVPSVASVTAGGQIAHVTAVSAATVIDTVRRRKNHVTVQRSPAYGI
jgi:hypothetical protein